MNLKKKVLFGGWISTAWKAYRQDKFMGEKNLSVDLKIGYTGSVE